MVKGTDEPPKFDILLHDPVKVVVVCQSLAKDQYRNETVPREIARQVTDLLDRNIKNKKMTLVPCDTVEGWLDDCGNRFDSFQEVGKAKGIEADIVIGIEIMEFRITEPQSPMLFRGNTFLMVKAVDCKTGKVLCKEQMRVVDPPNMPVAAGPVGEHAFRANFVTVVSERIACLFHPYDKNKINRMDAHSIDMF